MSKSGSAASEAEQGEREAGSVFDFLYHDARRVGSFLSQFDDAGHLQQITQAEGTQRGSRRGWKAAIGGNVPMVGGGNLSLERGPEKGGFEAAERVYDPLWTNAVTLLDFLSERDLLVRDLPRARIGQFVLVSGALSIFDASFMKNAWPLPSIAKLIRSGGMPAKGPKSPVNFVDLVMDLLKVLPHPVQAQLEGSEFSMWCGLAPENMVTSPSDLMLKHGTQIAGEWFVLGILDAEPDAGTLASDGPPELAGPPTDRIVATLIEHLAPMTRNLLGRQPGAYGVTPLLIFREISA